MQLDCKVDVPNKKERENLMEKLRRWANCAEIGSVVYASYCGADRRLADAIIAVVEQYQDHEIKSHS